MKYEPTICARLLQLNGMASKNKEKKLSTKHLYWVDGFVEEKKKKRYINRSKKKSTVRDKTELKVKPDERKKLQKKKQFETYVLWLRRGVFNLLDDFPILVLCLVDAKVKPSVYFYLFIRKFLTSLCYPLFGSRKRIIVTYRIEWCRARAAVFSINNSCYGFTFLKPFIGEFGQRFEHHHYSDFKSMLPSNGIYIYKIHRRKNKHYENSIQRYDTQLTNFPT